MLSREVLEQMRELIDAAVNEADTGIVDDIRANRGNRGDLLSQLDVLEKVRERINVGFERITRVRP